MMAERAARGRHEAHELATAQSQGQRRLDLADPIAAPSHRLIHGQHRGRHRVADGYPRDHDHGGGLVGEHSEAEGDDQADRR